MTSPSVLVGLIEVVTGSICIIFRFTCFKPNDTLLKIDLDFIFHGQGFIIFVSQAESSVHFGYDLEVYQPAVCFPAY